MWSRFLSFDSCISTWYQDSIYLWRKLEPINIQSIILSFDLNCVCNVGQQNRGPIVSYSTIVLFQTLFNIVREQTFLFCNQYQFYFYRTARFNLILSAWTFFIYGIHGLFVLCLFATRVVVLLETDWIDFFIYFKYRTLKIYNVIIVVFRLLRDIELLALINFMYVLVERKKHCFYVNSLYY